MTNTVTIILKNLTKMKLRKLTKQEIETIIEQYPEIAVKVISDYERAKLLRKKFNSIDLKKIIDLQIQNKICKNR